MTHTFAVVVRKRFATVHASIPSTAFASKICQCRGRTPFRPRARHTASMRCSSSACARGSAAGLTTPATSSLCEYHQEVHKMRDLRTKAECCRCQLEDCQLAH